jgi:hypothetical protein
MLRPEIRKIMDSTLTSHTNPEVRAFARLQQTLALLRGRAEQPAEAAVYLREEQRAERSLAAALAKLEPAEVAA